jgi:hypothetical protein
VKIDVGDMILEMLVTETINMLNQNGEDTDTYNYPVVQELVEAGVK